MKEQSIQGSNNVQVGGNLTIHIHFILQGAQVPPADRPAEQPRPENKEKGGTV